MVKKVSRKLWAPVMAVWLFTLFTFGCEMGSVQDPAGPYQAEADAVVSLAFGASADPSASPAPRPDDDKPAPSPDRRRCTDCTNGRSGDGIGPCGTCGGDRWIDPDDVFDIGQTPATQPVDNPPTILSEEAKETISRIHEMLDWPPLKTDPTTGTVEDIVTPDLKSITLYINNSNYGGWPRKWWDAERPKMAAVGYTVMNVRDYESSEPTEAYFEIQVNGREFKLQGSKSAKEILEYLESQK